MEHKTKGKINLGLWDTAGQEDYDKQRVLSYNDTDVFLVCYSVSAENSFANVNDKWLPELKQHGPPNTPIVLCGTKSDMREEKDAKCIDKSRAEAFANKIGAQYVECSAKTFTGMQEVFAACTDLGLRKPAAPSSSSCCVIL